MRGTDAQPHGLRGSWTYLRNLAARAAFISKADMALSFKQGIHVSSARSKSMKVHEFVRRATQTPMSVQ